MTTVRCPYPRAIRLCSILDGVRQPKLEVEIRDYISGETVMIETHPRVAALIVEFGYQWGGEDGVWVREGE